MGPLQQDREVAALRLSGDRQGFIKGFLLLLVLVATAYAGVSFGKPYYRYNTLRSYTKDILLMEIGAEGKIREKVMAEAAELNIPLKNDDLRITKLEKRIRVNAKWSEVVDFWGYYQKRLDFDMNVEY
jgi:hypothetical protein